MNGYGANAQTAMSNERDMVAKGLAMKQAGLANTATPSPLGVLKSSAVQLRELLNGMEGERNRIHSLSERLLSSRNLGQGASTGEIPPEQVFPDTVEGDLNQLVQQAQRLRNSLADLADTLDSAV